MLLEEEMSMDSVAIKSLSFKSIRSVTLKKLDLNNKYQRCKIEYKTDTASDANLMSIGILKKLFPSVTDKQLSNTRGKHVR